MGQSKFRSDTSQEPAVSFQTAERHEEVAWLRDFAVGLAVAIGAGTLFALATSLGQVAWAALG